jgi:signal transduction histidine kinase
MLERRSLKWPITLGVTMIVLLVALTVGWVLLSVFSALADRGFAPLYWTLLSVGTVFLVLVLVGVIIYLALSVKAINLNRRQSNFIDSVTHELKSPIASLKLYLQTMHRREISPEEREDFIRYMLDDVERLDHLINHLLDAARLERAADSSELETVRVDEVVRSCAEEVCLRHRAPEDVIHLVLEPAVVAARPVDLNMIFRNLIDNALKYAGDSPWIEIESRPDDEGWVVTTVSDNGCGVPRSMRRKVFQRFVRLGMELERDKPGTGLGLYIVRTLVRRVGGQVTMRDRATGTGTTFEVRLPGTRWTAGAIRPEKPPKATTPSAPDERAMVGANGKDHRQT